MRRTTHVLAATGAVLALGLTALPATASTLAGSAAAGPASSRRHVAAPAHPARSPAQSRAERVPPGQRGAITGMVRGPGGAPKAGVCVMASGPMATRKAFTGADGRFVIAGLPRGAYRAEFRGCSRIGRFTGQWYGGLTRGSATQVLVTSGMPVQLAPVTLSTVAPRYTAHSVVPRPASPAERLLAQLRAAAVAKAAPAASAPSARVSGLVTSRSGRPVKGVCVFVSLAGRRFGGLGFGARTGKAGRYTIPVRRAGRYYVVFLPGCGSSGNLAPQLWKGAGSTAAATVLRIRARQVIRHIDAALGVGAAISGRVRSGPRVHASLAGMCVFAVGLGGQRLFSGFTTTRANGSFLLRNLATGRYRLQFFPGCGPSSAYLPATLRKPVAVTDGRTTAGVGVMLRLGGTITGVVKDAGGHPLTGICVNAFGRSSGSGTRTGAGGAYRIEGLPTGRYQMQFSTGCGNNGSYAPLTLPNAVPVRAGKTTSGVDATMQLAGVISGVVKDSAGSPLAGICVIAQATSGQGFGFSTTSASGTYQDNGLPAGSYQVAFVPGGVFSSCGNNGNYLPVTLTTTVSSGKTTGLDATLPTGGAISGTVSDSHGNRLAGICVISSSQNGNQVSTAQDGSYSMTQLFSGSYDVGFGGGCGNRGSVAPQAYHGDPTFFAPQAVSVTAGQATTGIDATMQPGGTITGHVTDAAGDPLNRACVFVSGATGAGGGFNFASTELTRNGAYQAANLPPGQFSVSFDGIFNASAGCAATHFAAQEFRGLAGGTPDLVSASGGAITSGVSAALQLAGSIAGVVRSRGGRPLPGTCVTAIDPRTQASGQAFAQGHGKYVITGVPAGRYRVEFTECGVILGLGPAPDYASQWYRGRTSYASATPVTVRAGRATPNIDSALVKGGSITGQVVFGSSGRPISFVCVGASRIGNNPLGDFSQALTDRRGRYAVTGLSTGQYMLEFTPCSSESALAGQVRPSLVHVVAGRVVTGIDQRLGVGGSLSGAVSGQAAHGSNPAPGACVEVLPLSRTAIGGFGFALAGGSYSVSGLAPGRYQVYFGDPTCSSDAPALAPMFYPGKPLVIARQTTTGISATLPLDGGIAGLVRGPGHSPVAGICAQVVPVSGGLNGSASPVIAVTTGGGYTAIDLVPGSYKVRFGSGCGATGYATRWYKNAGTPGRATIVRVSAGTITTGIGITLRRG